MLAGGIELVAGTEVAAEEEIGELDAGAVTVLAAGLVPIDAVEDLVAVVPPAITELDAGALVTLLAGVAGEPVAVLVTVELEKVTELVGAAVDEGVGVPARPHAGKTERMVAPPAATPALCRNSLLVSFSFRSVLLRALLSLAATTISFLPFQFPLVKTFFPPNADANADSNLLIVSQNEFHGTCVFVEA
jgi:hypothetical protein